MEKALYNKGFPLTVLLYNFKNIKKQSNAKL